MGWTYVDLWVSLFESLLYMEFVTRYNGLKWNRRISATAFITVSVLIYTLVVVAGYQQFAPEAKLFIRTGMVFLYALYFLGGSMAGKIMSCLFFPLSLVTSQVLVAIFAGNILNINLSLLLEGQGLFHSIVTVLAEVFLYYATRVFLRFKYVGRYPYNKLHVVIVSLIPVITILFMVVIMDAAIDNQIRDLNSLYLIISVLGVLVINMTMFYLFSKLGKEGQLALENRLLRQQNKFERKNMEDLKRFYDQTRNMKHEMKNHLLYIAHGLEEGHIPETLAYIEELQGKINQIQNYVHTENDFLNFVLNTRLSVAAEQAIPVKVQIEDTDFTFMERMDLHSLLGNILDNAMEASVKLPASRRDVGLELSVKRGYHSILVRNHIQDSVLAENPHMSTSKKDVMNHGIGVTVIRKIAERYKGHVDFYEKDDYLCVQVLLPARGEPQAASLNEREADR